jgi:hypothetical protein
VTLIGAYFVAQRTIKNQPLEEINNAQKTGKYLIDDLKQYYNLILNCN